VHNVDTVKILFNKNISETLKLESGYMRIYKLIPQCDDTNKINIIGLILANDMGHKK
jgi:ribosomal protein L17